MKAGLKMLTHFGQLIPDYRKYFSAGIGLPYKMQSYLIGAKICILIN
jgi:hypothetical protein